MIDRKALLNDLKQQVKAVETDLGRQVKALGDVGARLKAEYDQARKLGRTAATWTSWLDERVTQVAVAWVLGSVFVRFCEDNRLIPEPYLTGPDGDRRELAESRYDAYVESDEDPTYRGWLEKAFEELGQGQAGRLLFDKRHNPLYQVPLSHDGARDLVEFWRGRDEAGVLIHDFTDPLNEDGTEGWDTRFLGDLYQDLSEAARKTYALLQTPEFVEEFILDRTMNPAVREFGYEELKMIDPTCGSGHFVLGAFRRLVRLWGEGQPGKDVYERVSAALKSVHGVDVNPFAVAIARFRLLVAAMAAGGVRTLAGAAKYDWPLHLAVGDSLIKARRSQQDNLFGETDAGLVDELAEFKYATEDVHEYQEILRPGRYHVVVGNPPYITVKDKTLNALYRELYPACAGKYALSVPFAQRFFELAQRGDAEGRGYGIVGQITANSFMKREFGTKLIEGYFGHAVELTEVIDTSGAYIPGHGTPTVILVGRRRGGSGRSPVIRTVRSVQGEPSAPDDAEEGLVWRAIVEQIDKPGSVSQWVSVDDLDREKYFAKQPWVLADGGQEMLEQINTARQAVLKRDLHRIGFYGIMGSDDAMSAVPRTFTRINAEFEYVRRLVVGDEVRDFQFADGDDAFHPYDSRRDLVRPELFPNLAGWLWPYRTELGSRATFSGGTYFTDGRPWWEWHQLPKDQGAHEWAIPFAFVATHNHFVLDRGGKVFKQSAPVIKLREKASEEEHLRLLGLLNSSTAGFWLKQVSHSKGNGGIGGGISDEFWEHRFEFTGTKLEEFPLPPAYPTALGTALDSLAQRLAAASPAAVAVETIPTAAILREAASAWELTRARVIALQEELDWQVYSLYSLHPEDLRVCEDPDDPNIPEIALGERAFEIVLARRVAAGEASDEWFKRHNSTPITEIPAHWPAPYREIVQKRIDAIESNRAIGMVERPEYKRRWATEGWDALQEKALRSWLLDRMENRDHWFDENGQPTILTLARLTDSLSRDEDFVSVAKLYAPRKELAKVVAELITDEHVPFLPALRYKPSGLKKRADWEEVWDLQRKEDAAPDEPAKRKIRDSIPVPPKYTSADFLRPSYWRARGKLDVPKERFISYGQTNAATPELYGWAGWDHREQAQALATYFTNAALSTEEITPFLAGLLELQPWLSQWHDDFDMNYSGSPADFFAGYRQQKQGEHGLTDDDLRGWRPPAATRGRRAAAKQ
ncbi:BREX-2 system adenine-specific DNA-methyltransferase PglX [Streptomyces caniscabiei]|uniref:site-specific DNA-methyltransferase (adenine-specific) n=1 Tax=Streptomyces caniscabiei TaxID=2746961 RepID=A0A927QJ99_9ACTN|nr:BREX-2 system adenine-specific DNA-methyltransferase PglX [Streptomyces caniscabiei]MBD9727860.1 BREX-2 system adenine-specific DNA-methyltransferase PglX [Streptomyces caniscabiei]MDX3513464.1 BREX-2 system adenine-specific DNA-methyltransferase PglX [Streptomyces caniscabiei]MDX3722401.1 BREX-2 system adenine-specific DNA-methyltransferase PglX [Streptomyces caniscabiei]WEO27420.1 BREX-2 system adenine-specific DNA-methyltransferase PglX [Streptomyces caniscabiei]